MTDKLMKNKILVLTSCVIILFSCTRGSKTDNSQSDKSKVSTEFNRVLNNYYEDGLKLNPLLATWAGDSRYNNSFPNTLTDEYKNELKSYYRGYSDKITQYNDADLSETNRMSKAVLKWECDINLEGLNFRQELFPIDQFSSVNIIIGQFASGSSAQPFKTVEDYNNWLERLDGYLKWLDTAEIRMKEGIDSGYVLPKSLIIKIIPQLKSLTETDPGKQLFYAPVRNFPDSFTDQEKQELTKAYTEMITGKIIPAYKKLLNFMSTDYLAAGRETSGINAIPNGQAYYNYLIKYYTTTNMTADEIHQLGLSEVARISSEMEKVKTEVGYKGDLKSFFDFVRNNKKLMPFTEPQQVIDHFYAIEKKEMPQIDKLFDLKPKTLFEVKRTEAFREKSASAEYNQGSLDGTRPGIFYVPIPDVTKYNIFSDESLFLHEAIPGHHFQISLTQESKTLPMFRKTLWYSAYGEGWALYCESLGKELGLYSDPYQYFGMLSEEMHRAIRLVVDTGIHSKGWTREQAINYSLDREAESKDAITAEIERYMAVPGQALSYKIGQLKIRELRTRAENELGNKFDIRQFHNQVLETGCIPLALFEENMNRWIASYK